jgi:hypothetical protein
MPAGTIMWWKSRFTMNKTGSNVVSVNRHLLWSIGLLVIVFVQTVESLMKNT